VQVEYYQFASSQILVFVLYLEPKEVFLILMFANFGVKLKLRYCLLKHIFALYFNILCFKFLYLQTMEAWLAVTILMEFIPLCCDIPIILNVLLLNIVKFVSLKINNIQFAYIFFLYTYFYVSWWSVRRTETCSIIDTNSKVL
jgi:hypothetical protein